MLATPPEPTRQMLLAPVSSGGAGAADLMTSSHPSDPVEMRRMNFQTPALLNHQPIAVADLAQHIDALKAQDCVGFSQVRASRSELSARVFFTWRQ